MIIKHSVKLSWSFHSEIVFIMILSQVVLLLLSLGQDIIKCSSSSISEKIDVTSAQFCHKLLLLRNKILPRASTSRN